MNVTECEGYSWTQYFDEDEDMGIVKVGVCFAFPTGSLSARSLTQAGTPFFS